MRRLLAHADAYRLQFGTLQDGLDAVDALHARLSPAAAPEPERMHA